MEVHAKKRTKDLMKPLNNDLLYSMSAFTLILQTGKDCVSGNESVQILFSLNRGKRRTCMHVVSAQTLCSLMLDASCFQDLLGN